MGLIGARSVEQVVEHSREFVVALEATATATDRRAGGGLSVVDIGSGGGIPGLVLATDRPDLAVTLVDRRQKCADFLERAVSALDLRDRVQVRCVDTDTLAAIGARFDVVTARGFGPPEHTLSAATRLVRPAGRILISEPPNGERWVRGQFEPLGLSYRRVGSIAVFTASE